MKISIYALVEPDCEVIRYIGQSTDPENRFKGHIRNGGFGQSNPDKAMWISNLLSKGKRPRLRILETCGSPTDANVAERRWIKQMIIANVKLLNIADGGAARSHTLGMHTTPDEWIEFGNTIKRVRKELSAAIKRAGKILGASAVDQLIKIERQVDAAKFKFEQELYRHIDCGDFRQRVFYGEEITPETSEVNDESNRTI